METHPKAGQKFYHDYLRRKYRGNHEKLKNELEFYGVKVKTGSGSFNANLRLLKDFKLVHPINEFGSYEDMKGSVYLLENMSNVEKRAFAKNFKMFSESLPDNMGLRIGIFAQNTATGEINEKPQWISFSKNPGEKDADPDFFLNMWKRNKSFTFSVTKDMTQETPFKEYKVVKYRITSIEIQSYKIKEPKAGGSFPYKLVDDTFDLSKYQIYSDEADVDTTPCFLYTLKQSGLVPESTLISIEKDMDDIKTIEFPIIESLAKKYMLNIHVTSVYVREDKTIYTRPDVYDYNYSQNEIRIAYMFGHFFLDEKIYLNTHYYKHRNNPDLDMSRKHLVWKMSRGELKYFKSIPDKCVPFKYVHEHVAEIYRCNGFLEIKRKLLKKKEKSKIRPYTFTSIDQTNFKIFDRATDWYPSKIYAGMKDLYMISGNIYNIVKNCERAGRYLFNEKLHITERLVCLDVNSMYPYVMMLIGVQLGKYEIIPKGADVFKYNSAFLLIRITKVKKHRKFDVFDDLEPGEYFVRLIDLKDLIEYNEIEYEIIDGIGAMGKRDFSLNPYILDCYEKKKSATNEEERLAAKLVLNRELYGYSLLKPKARDMTIMTKEQRDSFMRNHNNRYLGDVELEDGTYNVRFIKRITNAYNMANFGVEVSGYARHILNRYIYTCEDNGIEVFYGFTDSFYIRESDLDKFKTLFPNAMGDNIGQLKIEKYIDEAYFIKKSIFGLKLSEPFYIKKLKKSSYYLFSAIEDYRNIDEYGENEYFKLFETFYKNGKFKRLTREDGKLLLPSDDDDRQSDTD